MKIRTTLLASLLASTLVLPVYAAKVPHHPHGSAQKSVQTLATPINVNTANAKQLMKLSGIGASKAKAIVNYRSEHGKFASVNALTQVKGISQGIVNRNAKSMVVK